MPQSSPARTAALPYQDTSDQQSLIDPAKFEISVSQLLGYDYVFLKGDGASDCFSNPGSATDFIVPLLKALDIAPKQSVFITVTEPDGDSAGLHFTRHDLTWNQNKIESVQCTAIENTEQLEFINMIWQCSSNQIL